MQSTKQHELRIVKLDSFLAINLDGKDLFCDEAENFMFSAFITGSANIQTDLSFGEPIQGELCKARE